MRPLSEIVSREVPDDIKRELHLEHLQSLPASTGTEHLIVAAQQLEAKGNMSAAARVQREIDRMSAIQSEIEERDAIQLTRPNGCWCLGLGGRTRIYYGDVDGFEQYCVCIEGQEARMIGEVGRQQQLARYREQDIEAYIRQAGIPPQFRDCMFDTYSGTVPPKIYSWVEEKGKPSLYLFGSFGVGKTGLSICALRAAVARKPVRAVFCTTPEFLAALRASYGGSGDEREIMDGYKDAPILVLDDLGAEKLKEGAEGWAAEKLFMLINYRHDRQMRTIFTSNFNPSELADHIGPRPAWRVVEMAECVKVVGRNLRA